MINIVGVNVYGAYSLLMSILGMTISISSFGIGFYLQRYLPSESKLELKKKLFFEQFYFRIASITILAVLIYLLNEVTQTRLLKNEVIYLAWILPIFLVSNILYSQSSLYFQFTNRVYLMNIIGLSYAYIDVLILLLFYFKYSFISINVLLISQIVSCIIITAPSFIKIYKEIGFGFYFNDLKSFVKEIKIGFPMVLNLVVDFILSSIDRYVIAFSFFIICWIL